MRSYTFVSHPSYDLASAIACRYQSITPLAVKGSTRYESKSVAGDRDIQEDFEDGEERDCRYSCDYDRDRTLARQQA